MDADKSRRVLEAGAEAVISLDKMLVELSDEQTMLGKIVKDNIVEARHLVLQSIYGSAYKEGE